MDRSVRRALAHLHAHAARNVTLDELAHAARAEKFQLLRAFERELGAPPHRYLVALRVQRAQRLLARGMAVSEVAALLGFADQSHLTRRFKQIVGATPAAWAKAVAHA